MKPATRRFPALRPRWISPARGSRTRAPVPPVPVGAALSAMLTLGAVGCATINPTMTPARVLGPGKVNADLGSAYIAPVVESRAVLSAAHEPGAGQSALTDAALAYGATPPGPGGYLLARAGLGGRAEAHVGVVGRTVRAGARRVFWTDVDNFWALSLGVQARAGFLPWGLDGTVPGLSVSASQLYGADAQALLGRTKSDLYDFWLGLRAGYTYGDATMSLAGVNAGAPFRASLNRFDAAFTLGLRAGFGRLAGMVELEADVGYFNATSPSVNGAPWSVSGAVFSLIPAAGLSYGF